MSARTRFSSKVMGGILKKALDANMDVHQHRGEFVEGCLQCEKCRLIRQIAMETHQVNIIEAVLGKSPSMRGRKKAYSTGIHGERMLIDDTDMRVSGKVRRGL